MTKEYLNWERQQPEKHEFYQNEIIAVEKPSLKHIIIVSNIACNIANKFLKCPCEVYFSQMRVKIVTTGNYFYPDVVATCKNPEFEDQEFDTLVNPEVIFEVFSNSSKTKDREIKFKEYKCIPSLKEYILISQDKVFIEHFIKNNNNSWLSEGYKYQIGELVNILTIDCKLKIDEIYLKVLSKK